jgi:hypothetical protein
MLLLTPNPGATPLISSQTDDRVWYILLGAVLALSSSLIIYFLNHRKEERRIKAKLKAEVIGLCEILVVRAIQVEISQIDSMFALFLGLKVESNEGRDSYLETTSRNLTTQEQLQVSIRCR